MLGDVPLTAFIPVTDVTVARGFYESTLGLTVLDVGPFALVVDAHGTKLRLTPVPFLQPQPFTIAGWEVTDIKAMVEALVARGVTFVRYDGMDHSPSGVWAAPSGDLVAWFLDPDGNTLSLTEYVHRSR